jgi:hypothetical protein
VQYLVARRLIEVLDVRNLQGANCLDRRRQRCIRRTGVPATRQLPSGIPQRSKNLRSIEPLPRTVLAKTHRRFSLIANISCFGPRATGYRLRATQACHTFPFALSLVRDAAPNENLSRLWDRITD